GVALKKDEVALGDQTAPCFRSLGLRGAGDAGKTRENRRTLDKITPGNIDRRRRGNFHMPERMMPQATTLGKLNGKAVRSPARRRTPKLFPAAGRDGQPLPFILRKPNQSFPCFVSIAWFCSVRVLLVVG